MSLVIGSAVTILDLWIYLMHRADQELARVNEELAELQQRLESRRIAQRDATSWAPVDWLVFYASIGRLQLKPRDLRLN